ncbi:response regulator transcription factor [Flavilitoribacter nigricans]|uniref:DNA-binding response regulator n=1 Tax=Flavilitoribacter nigricans (strain ATCC 23147 / DSM 23189 / NBRC 102662 / NCIMB 1420 / SS-2) TaxID=1122177 RepID=A0A2D0N0T3_FLAN2|nr:response regulator transcription factor [Flavilitoribacter nigricans]PHN02141.1 DNA-binding response regulator [Flavilitoribacter nigricans DSM 23189 = NBRC 102662]
MKILIIEDEPALAQAMTTYLEQEGNLCETAATFEEAWLKSGVYEYDCILVDIGLPGGTGLDIIRKLKKEHKQAGIIIVSAKDSIDDKITGLEIGSDDYLPKPFHLAELNARIKALLRRRKFGGEPQIRFREIVVDPQKQEVLVNEMPIRLTRSEYALLLYFLANPNRVLTKESVAEHLSGDSADLLDTIDFIYSHIKNLRKKLMDAGAGDYIKSVYGMGYKWSVT